MSDEPLSEELLLRARLLALAPDTEEHRIIGKLIEALLTRRVAGHTDRPPCTCGATHRKEHAHAHTPRCPARSTYAQHVHEAAENEHQVKLWKETLRQLVVALEPYYEAARAGAEGALPARSPFTTAYDAARGLLADDEIPF